MSTSYVFYKKNTENEITVYETTKQLEGNYFFVMNVNGKNINFYQNPLLLTDLKDKESTDKSKIEIMTFFARLTDLDKADLELSKTAKEQYRQYRLNRQRKLGFGVGLGLGTVALMTAFRSNIRKWFQNHAKMLRSLDRCIEKAQITHKTSNEDVREQVDDLLAQIKSTSEDMQATAKEQETTAPAIQS